MADRSVEISKASGIAAALCVVVAVLGAFGAVAMRAEAVAFGAADWAALRFTVVQAALSSALSVALAVPLARALARRQFRGRRVLVTVLGAPFILPVIVAVLGLLAVFGRSGWVNQVLTLAGVPPFSIYGLHGVVLAHVFFNLPLATRLLLLGWQAIPQERFRLAAQLNMTPMVFFRILERPMLLRVVPGALALVFVICLTSFAVALTLGGGPRATTLELAIYQAFRFDFDLARAALLSVAQVTVAGAAAALALWIVPPLHMGFGYAEGERRWDAPGGIVRVWDAGIIGLAIGFLGLPLLAVCLAGVTGLADLPAAVWAAAIRSLGVAGLSIAVLLALALPMAGWIALRRRGAVEAIGLLGMAASPLMIGTGWFILMNPWINPMTLALPVTALVNALSALPFVLRILVPAFKETMSSFGRLTMALGMGRLAIWRFVILPRCRRPIGFAAGLTGALSVGDLGVIALFADPDRATLPLMLYRLMGAYQMQAAAGAAVLLLILALGMFWICDKWGQGHAAT
jgi:thiamine transport system permease protein